MPSGYIGQAPGQGQIQYFTYIATAGQTTFSGIDVNSYILNYNVGFCDVFLNGRRLTPGSDYTATTGSSIVLQSAASLNDVLFVASASTFDAADWVTNSTNYVYTATQGQTTFTGPDDNTNSLSFVNDNILVSVNGIILPQSDYTTQYSNTVILNLGVTAGDIVQILAFTTMAAVNYLPLAGGTVYGNVTVGNTSVNTYITPRNININSNSNWSSAAGFVDIGTFASFSCTVNGFTGVGWNLYESAGGVFNYKSSSNASIYLQNNGRHLWYTSGAGSADAVATLDYRMGIYANGNIGINTGSPADKFQIDTTTGTKKISFHDASHDVFTTGLGSAITFSRPSDGSSYMAGLFSFNNGSLGLSSRYDIAFATGGGVGYANTAEAMRIIANGNVGIGNTAPITPLHVEGQIYANSFYGSTAASDTAAAGPYMRLGSALVQGSTSNSLTFWNYSGTWNESVRICANGSVGVGTATPSSYFHVASFTAGDSPTLTVSNDGTATGKATLRLVRNDSDFAEIRNNAGGGGMEYTAAHPASGGHRFYTSTNSGVTRTQRMFIDLGGNVAIGSATSNSAYQLAVTGNGYFSDSLGIGASVSATVQLNQASAVTSSYTNYQPNMTVNGDAAISSQNFYYNTYNIISNYANNRNTSTGTTYSSSFAGNRTLFYNYTGAYTYICYGNWNDIRNMAAVTSGNTGYMLQVHGTVNNIKTFANGNIGTAYGYYTDIAPAAANATIYGNIASAFGYYAVLGLNSANASIGDGYLFRGDFRSSANVTGTAWGVYLVGEDKNYFSGNVGIGNTAPAGALHITTSGGNMILKTHESTSTYNAEIAIDNSNLYIRHNSANRGIKFGNTAADWFTIAANGNIGIGASPTTYGLYGLMTGTSGAYFYNATASGVGVYGSSDLYIGVRGASDSSSALYGASNSGVGCYASSVSSYGVRAISISGNPILVGNNTTNFFYMNSAGNMYAPLVYSATVGATNRDLYIDSTGLVGYVSSLRESKIDISDIQNVDWIYDLDPVSFYFRKKDEDGKYLNEAENPQELEYGLIAEDVEPINEQLCMYDIKEDGSEKLAGVKYSKLIIPLLKSIQDLKKELEQAKTRISELESKI